MGGLEEEEEALGQVEESTAAIAASAADGGDEYGEVMMLGVPVATRKP